jgi:hypothetical protein
MIYCHMPTTHKSFAKARWSAAVCIVMFPWLYRCHHCHYTWFTYLHTLRCLDSQNDKWPLTSLLLLDDTISCQNLQCNTPNTVHRKGHVLHAFQYYLRRHICVFQQCKLCCQNVHILRHALLLVDHLTKGRPVALSLGHNQARPIRASTSSHVC